MSRISCWLILDEIGSNFPGVGAPTSPSLIAVRLAPYKALAGTTEWLRYREVTADRIQLLSRSGARLEDRPCSPEESIWTGIPFDKRTDARRLGPVDAASGLDQQRLIPTFLVTEEDMTNGTAQTHVYCCSRIRESGMLFSRIWSGTGRPGASPAVSIRTACKEQSGLLYRFTDEYIQTTRFESDFEIELKLTLLEHSSPWEIACGLTDAVQDRRIRGFIPDLGNEFQRWAYEQDTFEILAPEDKSGYVAFMRDADGSYVVKYKFFSEDALRRIEKFDEGLRIEREEFVDYIKSAIKGAQVQPLPHLVRTRFDVNVESAATGHFFGLEMDEVRAGGKVLQQLEIEYHKTRACYGADASRIDSELSRLGDEAEGLLDEWGIKVKRGYLSKLSFLKEIASVG